MTTIIEYTDAKPPQNLYPDRILSPSHPDSCCLLRMEQIGEPLVEGSWVYHYKRCRQCGFSVRVVVKQLPDDHLFRSLRSFFQQLSVAGLE